MPTTTEHNATQPSAIGKYHVHEALKRCHLIASMLEDHLIMHPYVQQDDEVRKLLCDADDALEKACQMIGGACFERDEKEIG